MRKAGEILTKQNAIAYIRNNYGVAEDYSWDDSDAFVFRHRVSRKWFCLFMDISASYLGIDDNRVITVVNLKAPRSMRDDLLREEGIYPAYHMNKQHWNTIILSDKCDKNLIKELVEQSYELTKK